VRKDCIIRFLITGMKDVNQYENKSGILSRFKAVSSLEVCIVISVVFLVSV